MRNFIHLLFFFLLSCSSGKQETIEVRITNPDKSSLFEKTTSLLFEKRVGESIIIIVDSTIRYQTMDGFGYSLTGGSAQLVNTLTPENRKELLNELFQINDNNIGISYLRISIGASDLDDHVFSYDDLQEGQTDINLSKFNLKGDSTNLIPVLKEILAINPDIKIVGSPWSPPAWMKDNNRSKAGSLKKEYYSVYANYFVKYVQEMKKRGITIDAVTIQNEPENPGNTPSLVMTSPEQNEFIKLHLGPSFKSAGITTKIILFDHNCDHPEYPIAILNDSETRSFVDGSAFHMYLGKIEAMSKVHEAHPDKNVYFTEQWTSGKGDFAGDLRWHAKTLIVGAPRNWSRNVIEWNLAADENFNPHTPDGGCSLCQGALTINSKSQEVVRNVSYYIIAHASRFVRPGSVRIASNEVQGLFNVAYIGPEGKKILIVVNDNDQPKIFSIQFNGMTATTRLNAGAVGTYVW